MPTACLLVTAGVFGSISEETRHKAFIKKISRNWALEAKVVVQASYPNGGAPWC